MGHEAGEVACQEETLPKIEEMQYDSALLDLAIRVKREGRRELTTARIYFTGSFPCPAALADP